MTSPLQIQFNGKELVLQSCHPEVNAAVLQIAGQALGGVSPALMVTDKRKVA